MNILSTDLLIITSAFASFFLYLFLQIIIFRRIGAGGVTRWLLNIYFLVGSINVLFTYIYSDSLPATIISFVLYSSILFFYVLAIFGITVSSIRVQILTLIASRDENWIKEKDILKKYNSADIVTNRLIRLTGSGELGIRAKKYYIKNENSPFIWYSKFHGILRKVFESN
ncbi:MAG: hypothetical protein R3321_10540 [Nitrososphaeraceae archaeon]|nr:hypothetical protein [Nitrososphaeraceae archaeon]